MTIMFLNGVFFAAGDDGQMRPVHEVLTVECGRDFRKCARSNTEISYNPHRGSFETHEDFWNARKFEVLMVPAKKNEDVVWVRGEVVKWEEYVIIYWIMNNLTSNIED